MQIVEQNRNRRTSIEVHILRFISACENILARAERMDFERNPVPSRPDACDGIENGVLPRSVCGGLRQLIHPRRKLRPQAGQESPQPAIWLLRSELILLQAVLGKFIRGIYLLGAQIDAVSLSGGAVVIDDDPAGTAVNSRRDGRGIGTGDLCHTTADCAHRGTVLAQPEEEEIGSKDATDIGIEKLRPSRAAGGGGSEELL